MDFSKLKKLSGQNGIEKLTAELAKLDVKKEYGNDDRFWYPAVDKAGNGYAVIRFLPPPGDEEIPYIRMFKHGFQGPMGKWYIENSLTTLDQQDPVSESNSILWKQGEGSEGQKQARLRKRKLSYISNIYIITDSTNPENNGKVKLFEYGKKIFDKLKDAMVPSFADDEPLNPFDLWKGANFKIKIRNVEGYRNYDKSEFDKPDRLFASDDELEAVWKQTYSLLAFHAPENFRTYAELKKRFQDVTGEIYKSTDAPSVEQEVAPKVLKTKEAPKASKETAVEEDDEDLAMFAKMAQGD